MLHLCAQAEDRKGFRLKVSDFADSRHLGSQPAARLTRGRKTAYRPHEAYLHMELRPSTDIYALGLLMWEMVHGISWPALYEKRKHLQCAALAATPFHVFSLWSVFDCAIQTEKALEYHVFSLACRTVPAGGQMSTAQHVNGQRVLHAGGNQDLCQRFLPHACHASAASSWPASVAALTSDPPPATLSRS